MKEGSEDLMRTSMTEFFLEMSLLASQMTSTQLIKLGLLYFERRSMICCDLILRPEMFGLQSDGCKDSSSSQPPEVGLAASTFRKHVSHSRRRITAPTRASSTTSR